jgi:outer membrane protein TolC
MPQSDGSPRRQAPFFDQLISNYSINKRVLAGLALGLAGQLGLVRTSWALPPLGELLRAGARHSFDSREAVLAANQRHQELLAAYGKLVPVVSATASYTRNQYQVEVNIPAFSATGMPTGASTTAVISPQDQLDAVFSLSVPLIDAGAWQRIGSAGTTAAAAGERAAAAGLEVQKSVARTYFQYIAAAALVAAAEQAGAAAEQNEQLVRRRRDSGLASDLDVARASADSERTRQSLADAELTRELAARSLQTLTGLWPSGAVPPLGSPLTAEAELPRWQGGVATLPQVRAAALEQRAAEQSARAAWLAYVPTVTGTLSERLTNAAGFGQPATWSAGLSLAWRADLATLYSARALQTAGALSQVRSERAQRDAEDQIFNAWSQTRAYLVRSRAARAQRESAQLAATLSHRRYAAGTATQLEVIQAERDAFAAEVARIQADADLAYSRVLLRLSAGQPPDELELAAPAGSPPAATLPADRAGAS